MTVTERLMEPGRFEVDLLPQMWRRLSLSIAGSDALVITPTRWRNPSLGFDDIKSSALYTGIINEIKADGTGLAGAHILTRMGDESGLGPWTSASPAPGFDTWTNCITDVFATGDTNEITLGSFFSAPGGAIWDGWQDYEAPRTAIERWRKQVSAEYRVNPDCSFDSGAEGSALFVTTPTVLLSPLPIAERYDLFTVGLHAPVKAMTDTRAQARYVLTYGETIFGLSSVTPPFRGDMRITTTWSESDDSAALDDRAQWELDNTYTTFTRIEGTEVSYYGIGRVLVPGDWVYLWDPFQGLSDTGNAVTYAGQDIFPVSLRCTGYSWPIERGMGVYVKLFDYDTLIDISDYVVYETGNVSLELSPPLSLSQAIGGL